MRIRMKIGVAGTFHNNPDGVRAGDVVDVDDTEAARYCELGYAEPVRSHQAPVEHAVASVKEERAVVETEPVKPVDEEPHPPEDPPEQATKRGPGRPRKAT